LLKHVAGLDYRLATACAVEIAVLHNFFWHAHLTWADVVSLSRSGVWHCLLRFHVANGFISLFGNIAMTWALVRWTRMPYLLANAASVAMCSLLNFVAGDRLVFRRRAGDRARPLVSLCGWRAGVN
jgi:putative flippase GtrA